MPDPKSLVCSSTFALPNGTALPEFDRFGLFAWDEALDPGRQEHGADFGRDRPRYAKGRFEMTRRSC